MTRILKTAALVAGGYLFTLLALGVAGGALAHGWDLARALM